MDIKLPVVTVLQPYNELKNTSASNDFHSARALLMTMQPIQHPLPVKHAIAFRQLFWKFSNHNIWDFPKTKIADRSYRYVHRRDLPQYCLAYRYDAQKKLMPLTV
jgi:hypothetical protein